MAGRLIEMRKGLSEQEKLEYAKSLGVSLKELYSSNGLLSEPELDRRIIEAERARRENRLWIVAVVSAAASVISAATALIAVFSKCN